MNRGPRSLRWILAPALALLASAACGDDSGDTTAGQDTQTDSSTGASTTPGTSTLSTTADTATSSTSLSGTASGTATNATAGSDTGTSGTDTNADTGTSSTDGTTGTDGSSSTGEVLPFPCDDKDLPVHVVGGGDYATIGEGVFATPPAGTVQICPGEYTESAPVYISHDMTIEGAGSGLVTITSTADFVGGMFAGGAFEVELANVNFEGFTLQGGRYGFYVYTADDDTLTSFRDIHVSGTDDSAIYALHDIANSNPTDAQVVFDQVVVEGVVGTKAFEADSAIRFHRVAATFTDCHILNNRTAVGGLHIEDSTVTFTGGRVHNNESVDGEGGGAFLNDTGAATTVVLDIVDSDWGAGAAVENDPADVDCGLATDVGWLGNPANATCQVQGMCCTPT